MQVRAIVVPCVPSRRRVYIDFFSLTSLIAFHMLVFFFLAAVKGVSLFSTISSQSIISKKSFLIEFDNTQTNANHIHTVWRDFDGDFGKDLIKEHYANSDHHQ